MKVVDRMGLLKTAHTRLFFLLATLVMTRLAAPFASAQSSSLGAISIQRLDPTPIRVKISDLPPPFATPSAGQPPRIISMPGDPTLKLPAGFTITVFAGELPDGEPLHQPRWLALTPDGSVLVTETEKHRIRILRDPKHQGQATESHLFGDRENGLEAPFGMVFVGNHFYVANADAILRFPYKPGQMQLSGKGEKIAQLPGYGGHWTRNLLLAPDGKHLYVAVGSRYNVGVEKLPRASVQMINLDGSDMQTVASGLRNPVGMDLNPRSSELYVVVNERDGLGDDLPPDYFTHVTPGGFYGWPYTYLAPSLLDPRMTKAGVSTNPELAAKTITPDVLFQPHSAPLGLTFYRGNTFPQQYRNGAFVALHGSWNRSVGTGYKIVFVPFGADNRPLGYYQDFLTGFLVDAKEPLAWGRPTGLLSMPDGSLLFSDDGNNRIYRVQYGASAHADETRSEG
jgi:glucose/arabinose dehydrogenase